jgi:hypothetical protein
MKNQYTDTENIEHENSELEDVQVSESGNKKKWNFKQFVDGSIFLQSSVRKQTKFILFLVLLCIIYIQNKYKNESILVDILKTQKEVKELRDKSTIYAAELMSVSRESEVIKLIDTKGLEIKELKLPPDRIIVKKKNRDGR